MKDNSTIFTVEARSEIAGSLCPQRRIYYEIPPVPRPFSFGGTIVAHHARYVRTRTPHGEAYRMFHGVVVRGRDGETYSVGCDCMDQSGYCMGHAMSREEFIQHYCGGVEPSQWRPDPEAPDVQSQAICQRHCA